MQRAVYRWGYCSFRLFVPKAKVKPGTGGESMLWEASERALGYNLCGYRQ